ncbi:flagellar assembly protein FliW [Arthrobacter sp. UKPF54-2]|uniref:flagellar assembly protein FliW n=1 Tax=Arthrobacter sp. UKPF54-2 TaxID=2600159 RepID=UPI0011B0FAF3|nr:flagellar assembly protein FliW [Arthrobacter sp. UKPF54-2]QDY89222.1 flagellar assembly protein FliW [Arthrobacter sp. UKPF54-2]
MNSVLSSTPVTFTAPMPGLETVHDFALRNIDSAPGLFALESGSARVRLFLADAAVFVPGYNPPLPPAALEALELGHGDAPQVLVVVNHSPTATSVNLMAPIVLNPATRRCTQLVLDGKEYPLRADLGSL